MASRLVAILQRERLHPWLVLVAALAVRPRAMVAPETAVLAWRSADLASVAWNYVEHGMSFLYPEVFWGGPGPNYVEMEFPLVAYATALLYKIFGFHEGLAIVLPTLAGLSAPLALYHLTRRLLGPMPALVGALLFALSPSFAFQTQRLFSDGLMVACSILAVMWFERWTHTRAWWQLAATGASVSLAGLLKPYALIVGAPLLTIGVLRFGWRGVLARRSLWQMALASLAPVVGWYWWAYRLGVDSGNSFGVLAGGYSKFARWDLLMHAGFWVRLGWRMLAYHLTPAGVIGAAVGVFSRTTSGSLPFKTWLAAAVAGAIVTAEGTHQMLYYQLPILPPACALAGLGLVRLFASVSEITRTSVSFRRASLACVSAGVAASVMFSFWAYLTRADFIEVAQTRRDQGERLAQLLDRDSAIIMVTADYSGGDPSGFFPAVPLPPGKHQTPPEIFYFSRHRGWYLAIPWVTLDEVERLRNLGARYFVVSDYLMDDVRQFRKQRPELLTEFRRRYRPISEDATLLVYQLSPP